MEGFTLAMALVDAVPVVLFACSMLVMASGFPSWLFRLGALLSVFAGGCKVAWKLLLGLKQKDIPWLNKYFIPVQGTGFALILLSLIVDFIRIPWIRVFTGFFSMPSLLLFLLWFGLMYAMGWYRKNFFDNSPESNWTAQLINCMAQSALLLALLLAK